MRNSSVSAHSTTSRLHQPATHPRLMALGSTHQHPATALQVDSQVQSPFDLGSTAILPDTSISILSAAGNMLTGLRASDICSPCSLIPGYIPSSCDAQLALSHTKDCPQGRTLTVPPFALHIWQSLQIPLSHAFKLKDFAPHPSLLTTAHSARTTWCSASKSLGLPMEQIASRTHHTSHATLDKHYLKPIPGAIPTAHQRLLVMELMWTVAERQMVMGPAGAARMIPITTQ